MTLFYFVPLNISYLYSQLAHYMLQTAATYYLIIKTFIHKMLAVDAKKNTGLLYFIWTPKPIIYNKEVPEVKIITLWVKKKSHWEALKARKKAEMIRLQTGEHNLKNCTVALEKKTWQTGYKLLLCAKITGIKNCAF